MLQLLKKRMFFAVAVLMVIILSGCQTVTKYFLIDPNYIQSKGKPEGFQETRPETSRLVESELDLADRCYLEGRYEDALAHYQKTLMINPSEEYAVFRIKEIKGWQHKLDVQNEVLLQNADSKTRAIESELTKIKNEKEKLEQELVETEKKNSELYQKLDVSRALIKASISLAENKFEMARQYVRKVLISNPDSNAAKLMWQKIKDQETSWLTLEKLKDQHEKHKLLRNKDAENEPNQPDDNNIQMIKTTKDVIQREAKNNLEEIISKEFIYTTLPDQKKKQELLVDHLREKAITIYQKSIEDYYTAQKSGDLEGYQAEDLKAYLEDVANAFVAVAKFDAENKNWESARTNLATVLENFKDASVLPEAYYLLASLLQDDRKFAQSYELFESLIDQFPDSEWVSKAYFKMAAIKRTEKKPGIAIELYQTILDQNENMDAIYKKRVMLEMANAMMEANDTEEAFLIYDELLFNQGTSSFTEEVEFVKAKALLKSKQFDSARAAFKNILTGDPLHLFRPHASYYTALSYFEENLIAQSIIHLKKSFEEFPEFLEKHEFDLVYAKALFAASMWDESMSVCSQIMKEPENNHGIKMEATLLKAKIFIKQLMWEEAKTLISGLMNEKELDITLKEESMVILGELFFQLKDWNRASRQFEICTVTFPMTSPDWFKCKLYQFKSMRKSGDHVGLKNLGELFIKETRLFLSENEEVFGAKKDEIFRYYYQIMFELGDFYFVKHEYDLSILTLKTLVDEYPQSEERIWSEYLIARAYSEKGDKDQAIKQYESLIRSFGSGFWVEQAKFDLNNLLWNDKFKEKAIEVGGRFSANLTS